MPSNLLLLPLLGGFWFLSQCNVFKFRVQRLDGYWLLLESSIAGLALLAAARLIVVFIRLLPIGPSLTATWQVFSSIPLSGTAFCALLLGIVAPYVANRLVLGGLEGARNSAVAKHGTDLDRLLNDALNRRRTISLTLSNRKWYVGYVTRAPNLSPHELYVSLLPVLSGCRDAETLDTEVTTDYVPIYESGVEQNDFVVTIPLDAITSASFFDQEVYVKFSEQREQTEEPQNTGEPSPL